MSWPKDPVARELARERHRAAQQARWTPEARAKVAERSRGQFAQPEARAKMSAAKRALYKQHPEKREALIKQLRSVTIPGGRHRSPALKAAHQRKRQAREARAALIRERAARVIGCANGTTPRTGAAPQADH